MGKTCACPLAPVLFFRWSLLFFILMRGAIVVFCGVLLLGAVSRAALVGDYLTCDTVPTPSPRPLFCWDTALGAARPNKTATFAGDMACCPLNLTAPLVILDGQALYVGFTEAGANTSDVHGTLRVASGGHLSVTSMNLTVHGDLVLESGARLTVTESNATQTRIIVEGCLRIANATELLVELAVSDGNQSRAYVVFEVPSGCINGSFDSINASYTLAAGQTSYYPPGMTSCPQPVGLAVLVNIACDPPPPPPPSQPVWLPGTIGNVTASPNSTGAYVTPPTPFDWTLWGVVLGVLVAGILAAIITAVVLLRVRATRSSLFPYRDREHYQPHTPVHPVPASRYPSAADNGRGYTLSSEPRTYAAQRQQDH